MARWRRASYVALSILLLPLCAAHDEAVAQTAGAQTVGAANLTSPLFDQLPRPGYEQQVLRLGSTEIASSIAAGMQYDSNILAAASNPVADAVLLTALQIKADRKSGPLAATVSIFGEVRKYLDHPSENRDTFSIAGIANYSIDKHNRLNGTFRAERLVESRNDPEANTQFTLLPRLINAVGGSLEYGLEGSRFGFSVRSAVQSLDYLATEDAERSLTTLFAAVRLSYIPSSSVAVFVQSYVNRRDFKLPVDLSGVDRDATTLGATAGVHLSLSGSWSGEIGVGAFHANPDDPSLTSFSGIAANADLTWRPQQRTLVTLRGENGDSATVQAGAIGRTDTRISLRIDQEVRHNLLMSADFSYRDTRYRGLANTFRIASSGARLDYLVNRVVSIFLEGNYTRRRGNPDSQNFDRAYVGIGLLLRH